MGHLPSPTRKGFRVTAQTTTIIERLPVTVCATREAIREYENLSGTEEEFREPIGQRALHPITSHAAISLAGFSLIAALGLYSLGVTIPNIRLVISEVLNTNLTPYPKTSLNDTSHNAVPTVKAPKGSISDAAVGRSPANDPIVNPTQQLANNGAAKRLADDVASSPGSTPSVSVVNPDRGAQSKSREAVAYEAQAGDTIEGIALYHFGSTVQSLQAANPQLRDVNRIYPGDTIFLPAGPALQPPSGNDLSGGFKRGRTDAPARFAITSTETSLTQRGAVLAWSPRSSKLSGNLFVTFSWTAGRCRCRLGWRSSRAAPRRSLHRRRFAHRLGKLGASSSISRACVLHSPA